MSMLSIGSIQPNPNPKTPLLKKNQSNQDEKVIVLGRKVSKVIVYTVFSSKWGAFVGSLVGLGYTVAKEFPRPYPYKYFSLCVAAGALLGGSAYAFYFLIRLSCKEAKIKKEQKALESFPPNSSALEWAEEKLSDSQKKDHGGKEEEV